MKFLYNLRLFCTLQSTFHHIDQDNPTMAKSDKLNLEASFSELEKIINHLEDEQATLEESLTSFEQGIKLTRQAQQTLLKAEQKVKMLLEEGGEPDPRQFIEGNTE
jgi:exodeoxyribonuclease VII small subunit